MADVEKSLYLTFEGDYVPSTLVGEIWQIGVRCALVFGGVDDVGTFPTNWDVVDDTISRTESSWTISGNWHVKESIGTATFSPDDYLNDQVAPAITAFMAAADLSNQVRLRSIKCFPIGAPSGNAVPAPGQAQGSPILLSYTSDYPTGGGSGTQLPPQDSIAVSLRTNRVGRHGHGRIYLPSATSSQLSGAKVSTGAQADILDAAATFMTDLSYNQDTPTSIHVRPVVTGAPFRAYGTILQVAVGNIVDTQRRRRDRLTEVYTTEAVTY